MSELDIEMERIWRSEAIAHALDECPMIVPLALSTNTSELAQAVSATTLTRLFVAVPNINRLW